MLTRIAITGGSGFIGQHVLQAVLERDVNVVLLVRDITQAKKYFSHPRLTLYEYDIYASKSASFAEIGSPDVLLHLAWGGLPNYKSLHHYETELPAHYNFIKQLIRTGLKKLVVTGTCFEYGMKSGELSECMDTNPDNPYGFAKDSMRKALEFLQSEQAFGLTWARLFYLWGKGQAGNSLYPQLCAAIESREKMFDMSGGQQVRDYLPVELVVKYLLDLSIDLEPAGIVNVCSGRPVTVEQLVRDWLQEKKTDMKLNLGRYPYPDYEPMKFWGDAGKLESILQRHLRL